MKIFKNLLIKRNQKRLLIYMLMLPSLPVFGLYQAIVWKSSSSIAAQPPAIESPSLDRIDNEVNDLLRQGVEKYDKQDYKGAIADYDQAIKLRPSYADAYYNRGNSRSDLGDKKGAIADYDQAIQINRGWGSFNNRYFGLPTAYSNRGNVRSDLGDKKGAIADYEQAVKLKSDYAAAYYNRGIVRSDLGDNKGAIAGYQKATDLYPTDNPFRQHSIDNLKTLQ